MLRSKRGVSRKVSKTNGAYDAFKNLLVEKASKIFLKYENGRLAKRYGRKRSRSPREVFSDIGKNIEKNASAEEKYIIDLLTRFSEIDSSLGHLANAPTYLKHFPKVLARAGITERGYINYHIENYIQEVYILKERIKRFLKFVSRKLRKKGQIQLSGSIDKCLKLFEKELTSITQARGHHVHQTRYTDEDLFALTLFDLVRETHQDLELGYELLMLTAKSKWLEWIEDNNELMRSMVDALFRAVTPYVIKR